MKKTMIMTMAIAMMAVSVMAAGYAKRIKYHYATTVSPDVPELSTLVELRDDSDGQGIKINWKTAYAPSKATLDALDDATVEAWFEDKEADDAAEANTVSAKLLKAIVLVLADETGNTPAQMKAKIKAKYQALP